MSYKITWYVEALEDLEEIYHFYVYKSPKAANNIYQSIVNEVNYLKNHPHIAAIETLLTDKGSFRSLVTKDGLFKIIYYIKDTEIFIARVWCCRRDPKMFKV